MRWKNRPLIGDVQETADMQPVMERRATSVLATCRGSVVGGTGDEWFSRQTIPRSVRSSHWDGSCGHACVCSRGCCHASVLTSASSPMNNSSVPHQMPPTVSAVTLLRHRRTPGLVLDCFQLHTETKSHISTTAFNMISALAVVSYRIKFKLCYLMQTNHHGHSPTYLMEMVQFVSASIDWLRFYADRPRARRPNGPTAENAVWDPAGSVTDNDRRPRQMTASKNNILAHSTGQWQAVALMGRNTTGPPCNVTVEL